MKKDTVVKDLLQTLGYVFTDISLLETALTHPSYVAERERPQADNQRLEFLGDAVLQLAVSAQLYVRFPDLQEGELTKIRSGLINAEMLALLARRLQLGGLLRLGKGERSTGGADRDSNLADAFESVVAALYLDGGMAAVEPFVNRVVLGALPDPQALLEAENPKGALQELTQARFGRTPHYQVLSVNGPEHEPEFEISVSVEGRHLGTARASSRKLAEKEAARLALQTLAAEPSPTVGETAAGLPAGAGTSGTAGPAGTTESPAPEST